MSNFLQKQRLARESIEGADTLIYGGVELPAETVEAAIENVETNGAEVEVLDHSRDMLNADIDETVDTLEVLDNAKASDEGTAEGDDVIETSGDADEDVVEMLEIATESSRKRWGISTPRVGTEAYGSTNRRQVARESAWSSFKEFLKYIWQWLKEQGRKLKDRWVEFTNVGKTIQKRSKQYRELIGKLGTRKKDTVSGAFIKQLSEGNTFIGDETGKLKEKMKFAQEVQLKQLYILVNCSVMIDNIEKEKDLLNGVDYTDQSEKKEAILNGFTYNITKEEMSDKEKEDGGAMQSYKHEVIAIEDLNVVSDVKTPTSSTLDTVNKCYNDLGVWLEKQAKDYHKINTARDKFAAEMGKLVDRIDRISVDEKPELRKKVVKGRSILNNSQSSISSMERIVKEVISALTNGMNGYIKAGIGAYEVRK